MSHLSTRFFFKNMLSMHRSFSPCIVLFSVPCLYDWCDRTAPTSYQKYLPMFFYPIYSHYDLFWSHVIYAKCDNKEVMEHILTECSSSLYACSGIVSSPASQLYKMALFFALTLLSSNSGNNNCQEHPAWTHPCSSVARLEALLQATYWILWWQKPV